jgi:hypothetical protein
MSVRQVAVRLALAAAVIGTVLLWPAVGAAIAVAAAVLAVLPLSRPAGRATTGKRRG